MLHTRATLIVVSFHVLVKWESMVNSPLCENGREIPLHWLLGCVNNI